MINSVRLANVRDYMHWLLCVCLLICLCASFNAGAVHHLVEINDDTERLFVGGDLEYFIEPADIQYPDSIIYNAEFDTQFKPIEKPEANFGYVRDVFWFRLRIQSSEQLTQSDWYLELDYPFLDDVTVYLPNAEGGHSKMTVGDLFPFEKRWANLNSFLFPLVLRPDVAHDVYFRVETSTSLQVPLILWSEKSFIENNAIKQYWLGVFYGVMLVMLLYNFFVYLSVRDPAYVLYICYILSVMVTNMVITGVAFQKFWPDSPWMANFSFPITSSLTSVFALLFTRSFLQTHNYSQTVDKVLKFGVYFSLLMMLFPYMLGQYLATVIAVFMPIPVGMLIIGAGLYGLRLRHRKALFFLSAWGCLVAGIIARALLQFDLVPQLFVTEYGGQLGSLAEVVLLSLALADRINTDKAEKIQAIEASLTALKDKQVVEEELRFKSSHDQLTGAPNRTVFIERLSSLIETSNSGNSKLLVCTAHFENFHEINFTLGHHIADKVLIEAVNRLNEELSIGEHACLLSRVSGNKMYVSMLEGVYVAFIISVRPEVEEHEALYKVSQLLSKSFQFENMGLDLGGHIGISVWPEDEVDALALARKSMIAVRSAKWSKLPLVCYDTNLDNYSEARLSLMGDLITAIECDQLVLYFQPKIDLVSGSVIGMEALVRWQHPTLGLLGPHHFIDLAEGTGMIRAMTLWVLNASLEYCSTLRKLGYDLSVAVNLSVRNLLDAQFSSTVMDMVEKWSFPRNKLTLEVVESAVIEDMEQAVKTLSALSEQGFVVSLDDFGTGYSSLSYLKKLPINELKIDRSFVMQLVENKDDQVIVEMTLAIAKQLQLKVVAEGIEDEATLNKLRDLGCNVGQGYFIQRPIAGEALLSWLEGQKIPKCS